MKKWLLVFVVIVVAVICWSRVGCGQEASYEQVLTEIRIDIKYIKAGIEELKAGDKLLREEVSNLDKRVTTVEHKTDRLEDVICEVSQTNRWAFGIVAVLISSVILFDFQKRKSLKNG